MYEVRSKTSFPSSNPARLFLCLVFCLGTGCGLTYPVFDDNQPLNNPVRVAYADGGQTLVLEDGRVLRLRRPVKGLWERVARSDYEVEVIEREDLEDGSIVGDVFVKVRYTFCGTPWAGNLPLFPDHVPACGREPIDYGQTE